MKTLMTLSSEDLNTVTGGKSPNLGTSAGTGSSGSGDNSNVLSALQGIQSSLSDLGKNQNNQGLFSGQNGMMFAMALALSQRNNSSHVVVNGGYHANRGSFSWRASW